MQIIEFFNKNIDPEKIKMMLSNTKTKVFNKPMEVDTKKKLPFLKLFDEKPVDQNENKNEYNFSIPDNIIQQLRLWEQEKDLVEEADDVARSDSD